MRRVRPATRAARVAAVLALGAAAACGHGVPEAQPPPAGAAALTARPTLRLGVISRYNPVLMYRAYQPMIDYLGEHTPYRFELKLGRTYEDAVRFLGAETVDLAILGGLSYLEARRQFGVRPLARPRGVTGEPVYHSIFITRDDSPLRTLADLAGRSLALASFHSTAGNLVARHELDRAGVPMARLAHFENLPHHDLVVKAVLKGRFDAGAVSDVIARQYEGKGLRTLHVSGPIPTGPVVCRAGLSDAVAQALTAALLSLDPADPEQRRQMATWDQDCRHGFVPARDEDYDGLRRILNDAPDGCGRGCHPAIRL